MVVGLGNRTNDDWSSRCWGVNGAPVYAGAVVLVKALCAQGMPLAVVWARENNTEAALEPGGIAHLFDACIDGHVVKECGLACKLAPDGYLERAKALGGPAGRAVVVEDALADVVVTDLGELLDPDTSG